MNSTFDKFSTCGSVIGNDFPVLQSNGSENYMTKFRTGLALKIWDHFQTDTLSPNITGPQGAINITNSTFKNFNFFKRSQDNQIYANKVKAPFQDHGLVMSLRDFNGSLTVQNNNFSSTSYYYTDILA